MSVFEKVFCGAAIGAAVAGSVIFAVKIHEVCKMYNRGKKALDAFRADLVEFDNLLARGHMFYSDIYRYANNLIDKHKAAYIAAGFPEQAEEFYERQRGLLIAMINLKYGR